LQIETEAPRRGGKLEKQILRRLLPQLSSRTSPRLKDSARTGEAEAGADPCIKYHFLLGDRRRRF